MASSLPGIGGDDWVLLGATLVSVGASFGVHVLASWKNKPILDKVLYLLMIALLTWACSMVFSKYVLNKDEAEFMERYRFEQGIEGMWMETYNDPQGKLYYAVASITFNKNLKEVSTTGNVFDPTGEWLASWNSTTAYCDPQKARLSSTYEGNVPGKAMARGIAQINFHAADDTIMTATGSFADQYTLGHLQTFQLERLSPTDCELLCGVPQPLTQAPQGALVRQYHNRKVIERRGLDPVPEASGKTRE